jgi:hypothetical protein
VAALRSFAGSLLPPKTMAELTRLMVRHRLVSDQLYEIEAERDAVVRIAEPDRAERMIQLLAQIVGLGVETATVLVREMLGCRSFRDRRALASFVGLTGTPFQSGGMEREQGIGKNGNARVRRILMQLAWRWLRFQSQSGAQPLVCPAHERCHGAHPQSYDRGARPQAAGRALALCRDRRTAGGRPHRRRLSQRPAARRQTREIPGGPRCLPPTPGIDLGGRDAVADCGCKMPPSRLVPPSQTPKRPRD